jgi:AcrR family transcriptional regulator
MTTPDDTRTHILATAKGLFAAKGFDGTSVRDIVNAAGVNVSLVSYHFGGKDGLYRACIEQAGTNRLTIARDVLAPATSVNDMRGKLTSYIERSLASFAGDLETQKIIALELDLGREVFRDLLQEVFLKIHMTVASFLTACQAKGWVRADMDPRLIASMIQGLIINEARLEQVKKCFFDASITDPVHRGHCAAHIVGLVLDGVVA